MAMRSLALRRCMRSTVSSATMSMFVMCVRWRTRAAGPPTAFDDAVAIAASSDVAVLFLGEESILSGEAHSRADISLPGEQAELVRRIRATGKPVIAVILAGRPLTLTNIVDHVDAILFAWHPGTMGGPAIADLLFGVESPSGKLPATFPRMVGQIPIYYNQKNTGKPPTPDTIVHIDDIDTHAPQTSLGMTAFHLDAGYKPLYRVWLRIVLRGVRLPEHSCECARDSNWRNGNDQRGADEPRRRCRRRSRAALHPRPGRQRDAAGQGTEGLSASTPRTGANCHRSISHCIPTIWHSTGATCN